MVGLQGCQHGSFKPAAAGNDCRHLATVGIFIRNPRCGGFAADCRRCAPICTETTPPRRVVPASGLSRFQPLQRADMRFSLIDRVTAIEPGKSVTAVKGVSLAEEYLADHFPRFPVLPGVLMLEAMTQAAAWTIRLGEDFAHSVVVLRRARNVKYGDFAEPGSMLTVTAEVLSQDDTTTKIKAFGLVGDRPSLTARLVLERYNMADRVAHGDAIDARVRARMRRLWSLLAPRIRSGDRHSPEPARYVSLANGQSTAAEVVPAGG